MTQENTLLNNDDLELTEISDDIEVVGPGRMLKDARELLGLTQRQVADKLNFKSTLVAEIEAEQFDDNVPTAFNRGYLKNYAKLVNISQEDVLNSYEQLGVAQRQGAEMQSFSKGTEKQAEHKMVMWITYLILAILITATVVWWWQTPPVQPEPIEVKTTDTYSTNTQQETVLTTNLANSDIADTRNVNDAAVTKVNQIDNIQPNVDDNDVNTVKVEQVAENAVESAALNARVTGESLDAPVSLSPAIVNMVFTFSGDCWVNISDATGERIAWGVKKSGYIMRIAGQAPFSVTLGRPELVNIDYNDRAVDMSTFKAGNIAKFSLPLTP
ncbi:MAG: RodZ domain-containing protein [Cognaticolwellia sp.]